MLELWEKALHKIDARGDIIGHGVSICIDAIEHKISFKPAVVAGKNNHIINHELVPCAVCRNDEYLKSVHMLQLEEHLSKKVDGKSNPNVVEYMMTKPNCVTTSWLSFFTGYPRHSIEKMWIEDLVALNATIYATIPLNDGNWLRRKILAEGETLEELAISYDLCVNSSLMHQHGTSSAS